MSRYAPLATAAAVTVWLFGCGSPPADAQSERATPAQEAADEPGFFDSLKARNIGPWRGGRSVTVAGVVGDPMTYYMGATGGGVWKTTNGGDTWSNISDDHFATGPVGAVAVAASDPNVVVAGMGEGPFRGVASSQGDGVYVSTDAGATWTHRGLEATKQIGAVAIHSENPDVIWVAAQGDIWEPTSDRGVYMSTDSGVTWSHVLTPPNETTGAADLKVDPNNPRILYAALWDHHRRPWEIRSGGEGSGIWRSRDGGRTWTELSEGLPDEMGKIGVAPGAAPGLVWAVVEAKEKGGLYKSTDYGESWSHVNGDRRLHARSWYYMEVFADPVDPNRVYVMNAPFMASIDGGKSFAPVRTPHGDHHDLWINPDDPKNMINANDGGATITFDGGASWSSILNQPTAQFYRVNTDRRFAYRLYGGQQDNSTVAILSRAPDGSIGAEDFQPVGGCESAHVAMDKDDPRFIYAGCYLGIISEHDLATHAERAIEAYPELSFGAPPRDRRYRFNWNAPILLSEHDRSVIYHAGNVVLKSVNRGASWEEISPDLTRDEEDKQGYMGGPITNEVSENYGTILSLAEGPEAGVLWVGTDDGRVHVTRSEGESWRDVTPPGIEGMMVNAIDISPHDAEAVYLAVTGYKLGDDAPYIYRTQDGGATWSQIGGGIADGAFVRVVREDPERQGLLYAGTEHGLFVSFNDGGAWMRAKLNLPPVPITDLQVTHRGDLAIATQGRAFWVLDDLSPFRAFEAADDTATRLYPTPLAYRTVDAGGGYSSGFISPNPPVGAVLHYVLAEAPDLEEMPVSIEIKGVDGAVLRTLKADPKKGPDGGGSASSYALPAKKGLNRAVWDLRTDSVHLVDGLFSIGGGQDKIIEGRHVGPGRYALTLVVGEERYEGAVEVAWDPRLDIPADRIRQQQNMVTEAQDMLDELMRSIAALRSVKAQAEAHKALAKEVGGSEALSEAADQVIEAIAEWETSVVSAERTNFQDVLNFPDKLSTDLQGVFGAFDGAVAGPTAGMAARMTDVRASFRDAMARRDAVMSGAVADFNAAAANAPALAAPSFTKADAGDAPD